MANVSLPQYANDPNRAAALAEVRAQYAYTSPLGLPVAAAFHQRDLSGANWRTQALKTLLAIRSNLEALQAKGKIAFARRLTTKSTADIVKFVLTASDLELFSYYAPYLGLAQKLGAVGQPFDHRELFVKAPLPKIAATYRTDASFAYQFVAGPNPTMLRRMTAVPAHFPISNRELRSVKALGNEDLGQMLAAGRIYFCDYQAMASLKNGVHPQGPKYTFAPLVAFAVPQGVGPSQALLPFAIQCGQSRDKRLIFTPDDGFAWAMAKTCVLVAQNTYHETCSHLALTHLLIEPIIVATRRQLASMHPLYALLNTHFAGTLPVNAAAAQSLLPLGGTIDLLIGAEMTGVYQLIARERLAYSFSGSYLPAFLVAAGTADHAALPLYPYRDDGMPLWQAVGAWANDYVQLFYTSDGDVAGDGELQAWARELAAADGGAIKDFGATPGRILDREDLGRILTMIMFTCGPQHAAVNLPQADLMPFAPANPLASFAPEPTRKQHSEADYLAMLPPADVALLQYSATTLLGGVHHTTWGEYPDLMVFQQASEALHRFKARLRQIEADIIQRNRQRPVYNCLLPSRISQSINI